MDRAESKIDLNAYTTIPLLAVLVSIPTFFGLVFWLTSVANLGSANAKSIDKIEEAIIKMKDDVSYLRAREEFKEKQTK